VRNERDRHPDNAPGPWFIDRACIDCDAPLQVAPELFRRSAGQMVVARQPEGPDEERSAWLAALACPTRSIRVDPPRPRPRGLYPLELDDGVFYCGHNSPDSFGANAFFVRRPDDNALVDAPRFTPELVSAFRDAGGLDHILLTHRDDVADADRYADEFGARVWIHEDDADAAPYATDVVTGFGQITVWPGLTIHPIPGHTEGHVACALEDRFLFSGDSLYWSRRHEDLAIHRRLTWYSLDVQLDSLERLAEDVAFSWVLAGHGDRHETTVDDMHRRLVALVRRERA
jgi:glyoxylase-like metal-dependent hydrolase (beta-lactamase superfamily II)